MNGGFLINPTFLPRTIEEASQARHTSSRKEPARTCATFIASTPKRVRARRPRFRATASAARPARRKRSSTGAILTVRFNAFVASFPMDDPQYIVLSIIDEPKPEKPGMGATAGSNAAPIVANIIRRSASMLGVKPDFRQETTTELVANVE
jgi:cell division protein FtsI (penicillin-binding protein 3)